MGRRVLAFDLRNHGRSGHDPAMSYAAMAEDVFETLEAHGLGEAALVGHSMGGKVAMAAALRHPERVTRLLIADIAPIEYPPRYRAIADAMLALPLRPGLTRAAADAAIAGAVSDPSVRQFLLSNLRFGAEPVWRIGLAEIAGALPAIEGWAEQRTLRSGRLWCCGASGPTTCCRSTGPCSAPCFPHARFAALRDAGHWLHADAPGRVHRDGCGVSAEGRVADLDELAICWLKVPA